MSSGIKVVLGLIVIILLVSAGVFFGTKVYWKEVLTNAGVELGLNKEEKATPPKIEPKEPNIKIFNGTDRPIAFMIDNNVNAQPQSSINKAYAIYEIIVEGNETRLMALFKERDIDVIGPMRSARHYFIDYAMEHDAIYVHLGESPQAVERMKTYKINSINGQHYDTMKARTDTSRFWRSKRAAPHNAYTNIEKILEISKDKGYKTTSNVKSPFNYVEEEVRFDDSDIIVNSVTIPYSKNHLVKYVYDEKTERYTRYSKGKKQTDEETKEDVTTKNIIITFAHNYSIPGAEGRQDVVTTGELEGYYITNGKAIKITCKKESITSKTKYLDEAGKEIKINDGNMFVNICPMGNEVTFE